MNEYINAIEIKDLTKRYGGFILDGISFNVIKGTIMGFIGQNSAGKTTTIKSILNIVKTDGGTIKLFGLDHIEHECEVKERIAAIFDEISFYGSFSAVKVAIMCKGIYKNWDDSKFFDYVDRFSLPRKKKISEYSKGMKMKLQIAVGLSHKASLLIMDEATTGLDPVARNEILDIFREYLQDENNSILMSSHIISDLKRIADCLTFIDNGKILLTGFKDEIVESHALMKCCKAELNAIAPEDYISARVNDFGAEILVDNRTATKKKYPELTLERVSLEEIMLFYVNRKNKEWA